MLQRWKLLLITVEMLAVANAKDPERIQTALDQLREDFLGAELPIRYDFYIVHVNQ